MRPLALLICLLMVACDPSASGEADADATPRACDAIYIPGTYLTFVDDETGAEICAAAVIGVVGEGPPGGRPCAPCPGDPRGVDSGSSFEGCILDLYAHENTVFAEVPGYERFEATVRVPVMCHPRVDIRARLVPVTP